VAQVMKSIGAQDAAPFSKAARQVSRRLATEAGGNQTALAEALRKKADAYRETAPSHEDEVVDEQEEQTEESDDLSAEQTAAEHTADSPAACKPSPKRQKTVPDAHALVDVPGPAATNATANEAAATKVGAAESTPGQLHSFYQRLIAGRPDDSEHLPEARMEPRGNGVRLTFDSSFDDLFANPDQTTTQVDVARNAEEVWSAIGDHILRHHGRAIERLCDKMRWSDPGEEANLRDKMRTMNSIAWPDQRKTALEARDLPTLHLMASSGHFANLSILRIDTCTSEVSVEALDAFRTKIERNVRNWPKLRELVSFDPTFPRKTRTLSICRDAETCAPAPGE